MVSTRDGGGKQRSSAALRVRARCGCAPACTTSSTSRGPASILCHDLEMLWASVMAGRSLRVPVLYHAHEDWPAMVSERSPLEARVFANLEPRLCDRVDRVFTVGAELPEKYRAWGRPVTIQYGSKAIAEMPRLTEAERIAVDGCGC